MVISLLAVICSFAYAAPIQTKKDNYTIELSNYNIINSDYDLWKILESILRNYIH